MGNMITTLKNNSAMTSTRREKMDNIKKYHTGSATHPDERLYDKKLPPEELEALKTRIRMQSRKERRRGIIISSVILLFLAAGIYMLLF